MLNVLGKGVFFNLFVSGRFFFGESSEKGVLCKQISQYIKMSIFSKPPEKLRNLYNFVHEHVSRNR